MCEHNAKSLLVAVAILGFVTCLIWVVITATNESANSQVTEVNDHNNVGSYSAADVQRMAEQKAAVDKLVKERKKQAAKKGLCTTALNVAVYLGSLDGLSWEYKNNDLQIKGLFLDLVVSYQGKEVLRTSLGEVESYIPGEWESQLMFLDAPAKRAKAAKECQETAEVVDSQKAAFGLSEEDIRAKM